MFRVLFCSVVALGLFVSGAMAADEKPGTEKFGGLTLGVGLSLTHDLGWNDRVAKASVVNGVVRVEEQNNDVARLILEAHYFFTPKTPFLGLSQYQWGHGPFVAIQPGKDKIIDAIGLGYMIGFRAPKYEYNREKDTYTAGWSNTSWNFGVAFMLDSKSQILGDGIVENQPLPAGEKDIRYKNTSQGGLMFVTSFSFN